MVIFFGPAGSGKSVQGQMLADRNGWLWLSMGQLLIDTSDNDVQKIIWAGQLVSNEKTNEVFGNALSNVPDGSKVIIDGYPRQINQAKWLIDNQIKYNFSISLAVVIDITKEEILNRLSLRSRLDDTTEAIEKRLQIYIQETYPILDYFKKNNIKVVHINGLGTEDQVHDRVMKELDKCKLV